MARQILHEEESRSSLVRTAIYARVSTANNGQDPKMQTRELREYCKHRGWKFAGEYIDEGISGTKDSRPELNKLMADAHRRRFDAVVVWRADEANEVSPPDAQVQVGGIRSHALPSRRAQAPGMARNRWISGGRRDLLSARSSSRSWNMTA